MVDPLEAGLIQSAGPTHPGLVVYGYGFGLDAADEKKHGKGSQVLRFIVQGWSAEVHHR